MKEEISREEKKETRKGRDREETERKKQGQRRKELPALCGDYDRSGPG